MAGFFEVLQPFFIKANFRGGTRLPHPLPHDKESITSSGKIADKAEHPISQAAR